MSDGGVMAGDNVGRVTGRNGVMSRVSRDTLWRVAARPLFLPLCTTPMYTRPLVFYSHEKYYVLATLCDLDTPF